MGDIGDNIRPACHQPCGSVSFVAILLVWILCSGTSAFLSEVFVLNVVGYFFVYEEERVTGFENRTMVLGVVNQLMQQYRLSDFCCQVYIFLEDDFTILTQSSRVHSSTGLFVYLLLRDNSNLRMYVVWI